MTSFPAEQAVTNTDVRAMTPPPAVSVVIPTRNRSAFLREALTALRDGAWQDFEVIAVDQSDDDATTRVVEEFDRRFRCLHIERRGACPARNIGAAMANAEIIAFTDDDCVPDPDWLARIVEAFTADPGLDFIFGQLKAPLDHRADGGYPETLFSSDTGLEKAPRKIVLMAAGANMSCRASFLDRAGGFDDILGNPDPRVMNADVSMAYKAFRHARWIASPAIEVIHKNGFRTHEQLAPLLRSYAFELGANYGRLTRRGDVVATRLFATEVFDVLRLAAGSAIRGRRPYGLRSIVSYVQGFARGLLVLPAAGYVDGKAMRELRRLYSGEAASGATV